MGKSPIVSLPCVDLPRPASGWHDYHYAALLDGSIAILRTRLETKFVRELLWGSGRSVREVEATLSVFDGEREGPPLIFGLEEAFPRFDRIADKSWVIANARCMVGDNNARVLSPDGETSARYCLGDGINHLQCDKFGGIWVGYFDEGVYGNYGWGGHGGPEPLGAAGIAVFSLNGERRWDFNEDAGAPQVSDCYALNVHEDGAYACYYTDFPLVSIDRSRKIKWRANPHAGISAIAVDDSAVLLAGGYRENRNQVVLMHWKEINSQKIGFGAPVDRLRFERERIARLELPYGDDNSMDLFVGRGPMLHIVAAGRWHMLTVQHAIEQLIRA